MPYGDRTGPLGYGPRTGRGLGFCSGYRTPGSLNPIGFNWGFRRGFGVGFGRGFGGGFGGTRGGFGRGFGGYWTYTRRNFGNQFYDYPTPYSSTKPIYSAKEEKDILLEESKNLERELDAIKERISELEKKSKEEE
ncbi:MAG: DUF5320 domain-containing protein [Caldisericia bacterium]